jgi:PAS domain S-box-containing protein
MNSSNFSVPASVADPRLGGSVQMVMVERIFDHVPEIAFFIKDVQGRYAAVNQSLVERCGFKEKEQLLGRDVRQVFPKELAEVYLKQDQKVLRTGRPIVDHLEMHWYAKRKPGWCLTTKLPIFDQSGAVIGVAGISRDLGVLNRSEAIPAGLAKAVEYLEAHYQESLSSRTLADIARLHPARLARLIKRIFRLTPNQLILQIRLSAAATLLAETRDSVADVAYASGFYDHSALTRAFKAVTRLTPTQYRAILVNTAQASNFPGRKRNAGT